MKQHPSGPEIDPEEGDAFRDECGVVAVFGHPEAANLAYLAFIVNWITF